MIFTSSGTLKITQPVAFVPGRRFRVRARDSPAVGSPGLPAYTSPDAVWIAAGRYFATRPVIARALSRWGHILLPVVLIGIGLLILVEGGAFGL